MRDTHKRSTIYFDAALHDALRRKAVNEKRSVSEIVNEAVRAALDEDEEDLVSDLKAHGKV